jgi:DNA-binding YbaB/EbfC family protein
MFKDMGEMMKQAQQLQAKLQQLQADLAKREVTGSAGGGMVTVTLNGRQEAVRVHVDPQAVADVEMLEDLLLAALRDAHQKVSELLQQEMGGFAGPLGGLGLPGL